MPLKSGKENIGSNIKEMVSAGHPHDQAVAAAISASQKAKGQDEIVGWAENDFIDHPTPIYKNLSPERLKEILQTEGKPTGSYKKSLRALYDQEGNSYYFDPELLHEFAAAEITGKYRNPEFVHAYALGDEDIDAIEYYRPKTSSGWTPEGLRGLSERDPRVREVEFGNAKHTVSAAQPNNDYSKAMTDLLWQPSLKEEVERRPKEGSIEAISRATLENPNLKGDAKGKDSC